MKAQNISVYNPFGGDIIASKFDSHGGEYEKSPITIIGIVSGESQGGWSGHDLYTSHMIKLESWKLKDGQEFNRSKVIVFRPVEKSKNYFKEIPAFSVVEFEVFLNKEKNRAVFISGSLIQEKNEQTTKEIDFIKTVESITVKRIGEFEFKHDLQNFSKSVTWLGKKIEITIDVSSSQEVTDEIKTLITLIDNQEEITEIVMKYAIENILKERNEYWIESDEKRMTESTFREYSELEGIWIGKDKWFTMEFGEAKNIFNGGSYSINSILDKGCQNHNIGY